jgi:RNA-directed DNA polymerase
LIDKVYRLPNLRAAFARVKANGGAAGCDHQTIAMYEADLETNLQNLSDQLRSGVYRPQRIRRVYIPADSGKYCHLRSGNYCHFWGCDFR